MRDNINGQPKDTPLYGIVDERTKAVVYQGDAYAGRFTLFAVLFAVLIRGLELNVPLIDANWDLMLIVVIGGAISTAHQIKNKVLFSRPRSRSFLFLAALIALSALAAFVLRFFW